MLGTALVGGGRARRPLDRSIITDLRLASFLILALLLDIRFFSNVEGSLSFTVSELSAFLIVAFKVLTVAPDRLYLSLVRPTIRANPALLIWTLLAVVVGAFSSVALGRIEALELARSMLPGFVLFLLLLSGVRRGADWLKAERALFTGAICLGLLGCSQLLFGGPYPVTVDASVFYKLSLGGDYASSFVVGLTQHPNNFGLILAPLVSYSFVWVAYRPLKSPRALALAALLLGAVALYGTAMKGAFIWVVVGAGVAFFPRRLMSPTAILVAVCVIASGIIQYSLGDRSDLTRTIEARMLLWESALQHLSAGGNLIYGVDIYDLSQENLKIADWEFPHSHMLYLNNAVYFGVGAAAAFLAALWTSLNQAIRQASLPNNRGVAARAAIAGLVSLAGIGIFEGVAESNRFGVLYLMLALGCASGALARRGVATTRHPKRTRAAEAHGMGEGDVRRPQGRAARTRPPGAFGGRK